MASLGGHLDTGVGQTDASVRLVDAVHVCRGKYALQVDVWPEVEPFEDTTAEAPEVVLTVSRGLKPRARRRCCCMPLLLLFCLVRRGATFCAKAIAACASHICSARDIAD